MLVRCVSCDTTVLPKIDKTCPRCLQSTVGSREIEVKRDEPLITQRTSTERECEVAMERANQRVWFAVAIAGLSLAASAVSFAIAAPGQTYVIWTGGLFAALRIWMSADEEVAAARRRLR